MLSVFFPNFSEGSSQEASPSLMRPSGSQDPHSLCFFPPHGLIPQYHYALHGDNTVLVLHSYLCRWVPPWLVTSSPDLQNP